MFKNDRQRRAAFRNMKMKPIPSLRQANSKDGLTKLNDELFGFDDKTNALTQKVGKSGAFDHLKTKL